MDLFMDFKEIQPISVFRSWDLPSFTGFFVDLSLFSIVKRKRVPLQRNLRNIAEFYWVFVVPGAGASALGRLNENDVDVEVDDAGATASLFEAGRLNEKDGAVAGAAAGAGVANEKAKGAGVDVVDVVDVFKDDASAATGAALGTTVGVVLATVAAA